MAEPEDKPEKPKRAPRPRCSLVEKEERTYIFVGMLSRGAVNSDLYQYAAREWGLSSRQADNYIKWAREVVISDINHDRHIVIAEMMSVCRTVIKKSLDEGQYNCAVGAVNAIARLGGLECK